MAQTLGTGIKTAAKWGAGLVGAATAVAGALIGAAQDTASSMDVIDKASQRMGVSAEQYQELAYAAELCGVEMSTMEKAAKSLDEGVDFSSALSEILSVEDETERARMATETFGESVAYSLTPLLNAGAEGFSAMTEEANALGLVMSTDSVTAGAELNDAFTKVKDSAESLKNGLFASLMPVVQRLLEIVIENIPKVRSLIDKLAPVLTGFLERAIDGLLPIVDSILPIMINLVESLMPTFSKILDAILPVLLKLIETILPPITEIVDRVLPLLLKLIEPLLPLLEPIIGLLTPIIELVTAIISPMLELINLVIPKLTSVVVPVIEKFTERVQSVLKPVVDTVNKISEGFSGIIEGARAVIDTVGGALSGAWDGITGWFGHASGLDYVPYDGYKAVLHRGEKVLTADQNRDGGTSNEEVVNAIEKLTETLMSQKIVLSDGTLVGALTDKIDASLGRSLSAGKRGVIA